MRQFTLPLLACLLTACATTDTSSTSLAPIQEQTVSTYQAIQTIHSKYSFDETVSRLTTAFESRGMTIFAIIDHQDAAKKAGLTMHPASVIVYGTPKAGTPLMTKDPSLALQLPLKVLVSQHTDVVQVSYVPANTLIAGTTISPDDIKETLAKAEILIQKTVSE